MNLDVLQPTVPSCIAPPLSLCPRAGADLWIKRDTGRTRKAPRINGEGGRDRGREVYGRRDRTECEGMRGEQIARDRVCEVGRRNGERLIERGGEELPTVRKLRQVTR
jgi:hypothetical protein